MPRRRVIHKEYEGVFFAYELSERFLTLKLLRLIPLGRIRLRRVQYIRQRSGSDLAGLLGEMIRRPFRTWYWPHPLMAVTRQRSAPYIVRTTRGSKIYVRLRTGYHYRLRAAVGEAKTARVEETYVEPVRVAD